MNTDVAVVTKFPTIEDMPVSGRLVIAELQKLLFKENDFVARVMNSALGIAIETVKEAQQLEYKEFIKRCKLTQM